MKKSSTHQGSTTVTVVGRTVRSQTQQTGVFSDMSSSGGFSARVMSRTAFERALASADKKLQESSVAKSAKR